MEIKWAPDSLAHWIWPKKAEAVFVCSITKATMEKQSKFAYFIIKSKIGRWFGTCGSSAAAMMAVCVFYMGMGSGLV